MIEIIGIDDVDDLGEESVIAVHDIQECVAPITQELNGIRYPML